MNMEYLSSLILKNTISFYYIRWQGGPQRSRWEKSTNISYLCNKISLYLFEIKFYYILLICQSRRIKFFFAWISYFLRVKKIKIFYLFWFNLNFLTCIVVNRTINGLLHKLDFIYFESIPKSWRSILQTVVFATNFTKLFIDTKIWGEIKETNIYDLLST